MRLKMLRLIDASTYYSRARIHSAQGNLAAALTSYQASLAIRERLAQADPNNARWQRDLAVNYGQVALVEMRLGVRKNAVKAFQQGRDIIAQSRAASARYRYWSQTLLGSTNGNPPKMTPVANFTTVSKTRHFLPCAGR